MPSGADRRTAHGFTLIELMVVIAIIAVAAGVASLSLRDSAETQLEREAARLTALLEVARSESRSLGITVAWAPISGLDRAVAGDPPAGAQFRFHGLPASAAMPTRWLNPEVTAAIAQGGRILLGPEPLIGAQQIELRLAQQSLMLATDGLGPFVVRNPDGTTRRSF